jgi:hypothetical protein
MGKWLKMMTKQVTVVAEKGTELMKKSAILSFVFMAIKGDGEISIEVDLLEMTTLKNHPSLAISQSLTSCTTENEQMGLHGGDRFSLHPLASPVTTNTIVYSCFSPPISISRQTTHIK